MSSLKKQTLRKIKISDKKSDKVTVYLGIIKPRGLKKSDCYENIISSIEDFHIEGFMLRSQIDKIDKVERLKTITVLGGYHPNADPHTGIFCHPDYMNNREVNDELINDIQLELSMWNLLSCYYIPSKKEYKSRKIT